MSGTQLMQVFDVSGPVTVVNTFLTRPFRNNYRCTFAVKRYGIATVQDSISCTFKCSESAAMLGFETVPVGDNDEITWDVATAGLAIQAI